MFQIPSNKIKRTSVIPIIIFAIIATAYFIGVTLEHADVPLFIRTAIVAGPIAVSVSCVLIAKRYDNSKIFGKSYLLLGIGYLFTFVGEGIFFYHVDNLGLLDYVILGDAFILASYPFMMAHIAINIKYFAEKLEAWQWMLFAGVFAVILSVYSVSLLNSDNMDDFLYYLVFVSASSIVLGLAAVAFTMFRQTVLSSAWFVLLIGITLGTMGDVMYNHASTLGTYGFEDFSNILWITSTMIMIYALYEHRKNM